MIYKITHIADGLDPHTRILCNGDAYQSIGGQFSGLLRLLGDLDGLSELKLLYYYDGRKLSIYFSTDGTAPLHNDIAKNFVRGFPGDIYGFREIESLPKMVKLAYSVNVLRQDAFIPSTVKRADNPNAMDHYYLIRPLEPDSSCDHMNFERALGLLNDPVKVEITLKPFNVSKYISKVAQYQQSLKKVNSFSSHENPFSGIRGQNEWAGIERCQKRSDPVADDIRRDIAKLQLSLTKINLGFDIKVSSNVLSTARYVASVFAEETFKGGSYQLLTSEDASRAKSETCELFENLTGLCSIASIEELESLFRPPIAGVRKPCVIPCHTDPPDYPQEQMLVIGTDLVASTPNHEVLRGPLFNNTLNRHTSLFGITGSGKTVLVFSELLQLAERSKPFLVIESGSKTDYRALIKALRRHPEKKMRKLGKKIRLVTPGAESINPLRINPFIPPRGVPVMFHAENILTCFLASAIWPDPLPAILKKSIYAMYHEFEFGNIKPTMKIFCDVVYQQIEELDYDKRVKGDIKSAAEARLTVFITGAIGRIFQTESNYPTLDKIVNGFTIMEGAMISDEALAFVVFTLLTLLSGYFSVTAYAGDGPRFFTFLEELHNLVPPVPFGLVDNESIRAKASKFIVKQLLEGRSSGRPFVVIDQSPGNVDSNVLRNCVTTIVGKQRDSNDISQLAGSMLFGPADYAAVKKMGVGEFLFFTEGYHRPCLIKVPNLCKQLGINGSPFGPAVLEYIEDCHWYQNDMRIRVTEELLILEKRLGAFEEIIFKAIDAVKAKLKGTSKTSVKDIKKVQKKMCRMMKNFFRDEMVPLAGLDNKLQLPEDVLELKNLLLKRYRLLVKTAENFCDYIDAKKGV